ncbi:hypothetical protein L596_016256 [Steinernema carpocapsae]|uniref:Uncharacterized protein n=1 Tax=Steinernema carpocapsae TaxID=34508 RepID=A0A4U5NHF7_STECR|nr:hypothetical protein L596_016256 [Steinernema carpocapsae]
MNPKIFILLLVCTSVALACDKKDCHDLPGQEVCYDDKCSSGESLGCNAGGKARTVASADLETFRNALIVP